MCARTFVVFLKHTWASKLDRPQCGRCSLRRLRRRNEYSLARIVIFVERNYGRHCGLYCLTRFTSCEQRFCSRGFGAFGLLWFVGLGMFCFGLLWRPPTASIGVQVGHTPLPIFRHRWEGCVRNSTRYRQVTSQSSLSDPAAALLLTMMRSCARG